MPEPLLERIQVLERAVRRWKAISLNLFLILLSGMAIGGSLGLVFALRMASQGRAIEMARIEELRARDMAVQAKLEAEAAILREQHLQKKADPEEPPDNER
jgi:hypothetical protein